MKNKLISTLLVICLALISFSGCNNQNDIIDGNIEIISGDIEQEESLYVTFDAYGEAFGMLTVNQTTENGNTEANESMSWSFDAVHTEKISSLLERNKVLSIEPYNEDNDIFEGWIVYREIITIDDEGFETYSYEKLSADTIYSTNEILEMTVPDFNITFVAKWKNIALEDYSMGSFSNEPIMDTVYFSLYANGGTMTFSDEETENFKLERYNYWLNENDTLNDVMTGSIINSAKLLSIEKENATFTGWTVYEADSINWSSEEISGDGYTYFLYNPNDEDFKYLMLENSRLYSSNASTEEISQIIYTGNSYYAVANWEE